MNDDGLSLDVDKYIEVFLYKIELTSYLEFLKSASILDRDTNRTQMSYTYTK